MIIFHGILLALILYKAKMVNYNYKYIDKENTLIVKGVFVILVFFRHFSEYINGDNLLTQLFLLITKVIGQLMVGGFLYYSGYGMMESFKTKGIKYVDQIPRHNLLKLLFNYGCAVTVFLLFNAVTGRYYPLKTIVLSFIGWTNIGNSNWYVFACFIAYLEFYSGIRLFQNNMMRAFVFMLICAVVYSLFVLCFREDYWCSTYFCFFLGVLYSWKKDKIEQYLQVGRNYTFILSLLLLSTVLTTILRYQTLVVYILSTLFFCLFITLITMKIQIYLQNKYLKWLGVHTFSFYILQRIPMILFSSHIRVEQNILFFAVAFLLTCLLSECFEKGIAKLDLYLFR